MRRSERSRAGFPSFPCQGYSNARWNRSTSKTIGCTSALPSVSTDKAFCNGTKCREKKSERSGNSSHMPDSSSFPGSTPETARLVSSRIRWKTALSRTTSGCSTSTTRCRNMSCLCCRQIRFRSIGRRKAPERRIGNAFRQISFWNRRSHCRQKTFRIRLLGSTCEQSRLHIVC